MIQNPFTDAVCKLLIVKLLLIWLLMMIEIGDGWHSNLGSIATAQIILDSAIIIINDKVTPNLLTKCRSRKTAFEPNSVLTWSLRRLELSLNQKVPSLLNRVLNMEFVCLNLPIRSLLYKCACWYHLMARVLHQPSFWHLLTPIYNIVIGETFRY